MKVADIKRNLVKLWSKHTDKKTTNRRKEIFLVPYTYGILEVTYIGLSVFLALLLWKKILFSKHDGCSTVKGLSLFLAVLPDPASIKSAIF